MKVQLSERAAISHFVMLCIMFGIKFLIELGGAFGGMSGAGGSIQDSPIFQLVNFLINVLKFPFLLIFLPDTSNYLFLSPVQSLILVLLVALTSLGWGLTIGTISSVFKKQNQNNIIA